MNMNLYKNVQQHAIPSNPKDLVTKEFVDNKIDNLTAPVTSVNGMTGDVTIDKQSVGLGNVDNTSDANKPISNAQGVAIQNAQDTADTALSIASGKNQAVVFDSTADMYAWISDANNKGARNVGTNLYIKAIDVPDWWISEVYDTPDASGYYYGISQLETQKVDLTNYQTKTGNAGNNNVTYTSSDVADGSATSWTSVSKLTSGLSLSTLFARVSQMFKNVRYLYKMLGTTDISAIGDGTVTGGLSSLNSNIKNEYKDITSDFNNGTFSNNLNKYRPGNYIKKTYNNVTYVAVLADYNTFYNPGRNDYSNIQVNHWTAIIFGFSAGQMNTSNVTTGGFKGSAMHTWLTGDCTTILKAAFNASHLKSHQCLLSVDSSWDWAKDIYATLLTEIQVYGSNVLSYSWNQSGEAIKQLQIFKNASFMEVFGRDYGQSNNNFNTKNAWLRNISAYSPSASFCIASCYGYAANNSASNSFGRFPLVILC